MFGAVLCIIIAIALAILSGIGTVHDSVGKAFGAGVLKLLCRVASVIFFLMALACLMNV